MSKSQEQNNRKRLRRNVKIFFVILLSLLLVLEFFPSIYSDAVAGGISERVGDYGVLQSLDVILQDKVEKANSEQIENETQARLDQMKLVEYSQENVELDYQVKQIQSVGSTDFEPTIFRRLHENPSTNNTSILEWLLDQPLNYWIFTRSNGQETWTKASLRRTLFFPEFNLDKWWYINVDNNISNGNELWVRFDILIKEWDFNRPTIILPSPGHINVKGGFGLSVERLVNRTFPIELNVLKSVSYEGENY